MKRLLIVALMVGMLAVVACGAEPAPTQPPPTEAPADTTFDSPLDLPNPASKYCVEQGYELEIRDETGGQVGYCIFPDGSECEEWAFYRGECKPASSP